MVLKQIPTSLSIFPSNYIVLPDKIDCFSSFGIFNSLGASLDQFMCKYSLINKAKK